MSSIAFPCSIDTVKLVIPIRPEHLAERFQFVRKTKGLDLAKFEEYEKISYYLWPFFRWDEKPDSWVPMQFTLELDHMVFKFSLPKLMYGHSARHAWALREAVVALEQLLRDFAIESTVPWYKWRVRELHVSYNFLLESREYLEQVYGQLARMRYLGKLSHTKGRNQYAWWRGESKTVKFYAKYDEMRLKKHGYSHVWLSHHKPELERVLRYEEEWKLPALKQFLHVDSAERANVAAVLHAFETWTQHAWLDKRGNYFTHPRPKLTFEDIERDIKANFRKSGPIVEFAYSVSKLGMTAVKKTMKPQTFFNNQRYLDKIGVKLAHLENLYNHNWGDTVDLTGFMTPENIYHGMDGEFLDGGPFFGLWRQQMLENLKSASTLIQAV